MEFNEQYLGRSIDHDQVVRGWERPRYGLSVAHKKINPGEKFVWSETRSEVEAQG